MAGKVEDSFVGAEDSFVGAEDSFVGAEDSFVGAEDSFVGAEDSFVGAENNQTGGGAKFLNKGAQNWLSHVAATKGKMKARGQDVNDYGMVLKAAAKTYRGTQRRHKQYHFKRTKKQFKARKTVKDSKGKVVHKRGHFNRRGRAYGHKNKTPVTLQKAEQILREYYRKRYGNDLKKATTAIRQNLSRTRKPSRVLKPGSKNSYKYRPGKNIKKRTCSGPCIYDMKGLDNAPGGIKKTCLYKKPFGRKSAKKNCTPINKGTKGAYQRFKAKSAKSPKRVSAPF